MTAECKATALVKAMFTPGEKAALRRLAIRHEMPVSKLVRLACRHVLFDERGAQVVIFRA